MPGDDAVDLARRWDDLLHPGWRDGERARDAERRRWEAAEARRILRGAKRRAAAERGGGLVEATPDDPVEVKSSGSALFASKIRRVKRVDMEKVLGTASSRGYVGRELARLRGFGGGE